MTIAAITPKRPFPLFTAPFVFNGYQTDLQGLLDLIVEESFRAVNLQKVKKAKNLRNYCEICRFFLQLKNHRKLFIKQRCFLFSNNENKKEKSLDAT